MDKKQYKDVNWNYLTHKPGVQWWALMVVIVGGLSFLSANDRLGSWWISVQLSCLFHCWKTYLSTGHNTQNKHSYSSNKQKCYYTYTWKWLIIKHSYGMFTDTSRDQSVLSVWYTDETEFVQKNVQTRLSLDFNWEAHCSFPLLLQ